MADLKELCPFHCRCQDATNRIRRLEAALKTVRNYIEGETVAAAVVIPMEDILASVKEFAGCPSLLQFIDAELGKDEQLL